MKLDWRNLILALVALAMAGGVLILPAIYTVGTWLTPGSPTALAVTVPPPPLVRAAIWARFEGAGEPRVEPLTMWGIFGFVACNVVAEPLPQAKAHEERERCLEDQAGVLLAGQVSRLHLAATQLPPSPRWALSQTATMARLTREWDINTLLATVAAKSLFGQNKWIGIDQASQGFFGKQPPRLTGAEAALLSVQMISAETPNAKARDPWCQADRARSERDVVLKKMQKNGALTADSLESAVNAPLGVVPSECPTR